MAENPTILVADTKESILHFSQSILHGMGCQVLFAQDADEALEIVEKKEVDVALIDADISEGGGLEVVHEIFVQKPDVVVALMSPCGTSRSALQMAAFGIQRYLLKPFEDPLVFRRLVEESLEERNQRLRDRLKRASDETQEAENDEDDDEDEDASPIRIIVADCEEEGIKEIRDALSHTSCEIKEASCAQEALLLLSEGEQDIIVVGYDMGDMTADDVLFRAKKIDEHIAVIVTAQEPTLKMTTSLIKRGAAGFVEMPLRDPIRTASAIRRQGLDARDRREGLDEEEMDEEEGEDKEQDEE